MLRRKVRICAAHVGSVGLIAGGAGWEDEVHDECADGTDLDTCSPRECVELSLEWGPAMGRRFLGQHRRSAVSRERSRLRITLFGFVAVWWFLPAQVFFPKPNIFIYMMSLILCPSHCSCCFLLPIQFQPKKKHSRHLRRRHAPARPLHSGPIGTHAYAIE